MRNFAGYDVTTLPPVEKITDFSAQICMTPIIHGVLCLISQQLVQYAHYQQADHLGFVVSYNTCTLLQNVCLIMLLFLIIK